MTSIQTLQLKGEVEGFLLAAHFHSRFQFQNERKEQWTDWIKSIEEMGLLSIVTITCVNDVVILSERQHDSRISSTVCPQLIFIDMMFQQENDIS